MSGFFSNVQMPTPVKHMSNGGAACTGGLSKGGVGSITAVSSINGGSNPAHSHSHSPSNKQKRPLPAGVSAKNSTLPTPTTMGANVLDELLGEASDLLNAAAEAQALGRLKMSNSYLKLAHPRLVGLGKRFDLVANLHLQWQPAENSSSNTLENAEDRDLALKLMSALLPNGVKVDKTMLEHLSKAAMELHKKRSSSTCTISENNANDDPSGDIGASSATAAADDSAAVSSSSPKDSDSTGTRRMSIEVSCNDVGSNTVWSDQEHRKCMAATNKGKDALYVASLLGTKTVEQVRSYLQQQSGKGAAISIGKNNLKSGGEEGDADSQSWKRLNRFNARDMIMSGGIYSSESTGDAVKGAK